MLRIHRAGRLRHTAGMSYPGGNGADRPAGAPPHAEEEEVPDVGDAPSGVTIEFVSADNGMGAQQGVDCGVCRFGMFLHVW